MEDYVAVIW